MLKMSTQRNLNVTKISNVHKNISLKSAMTDDHGAMLGEIVLSVGPLRAPGLYEAGQI